MEKLIQFLVPNSSEAYKVLETLRGLADKGEIKLHKVSVVEKAMDGKTEMRHVHETKAKKSPVAGEKESPVENITENVKDLFSKSVSFLKNTFSKGEKTEKSEKGEKCESGEMCSNTEGCARGESNAKNQECANPGKDGKCHADAKDLHNEDFVASCQESCYGEERLTKMSEKIPYGKTAVFALVDEEWGAAIDSKLGGSAEISRTDIGEELRKAGDEKMAKLDEKIKEAKAKLAEAADEDMEKVKGEYDKLVKHKNTMSEKFRDMLDGKNADGKGWFAKFKDKVKDIGENIAEKAGDMKDAIVDKAGDMKDAIVDKAGDAKDAIADKAGDIKDATKDKTNEWQRSVGDKMQDLGKNIKDKGDDMKKIA